LIPKLKQLQRIIDTGVVAVVRAGSPEEARKIAEAVRAGGVDIIEITLTVPGALDVIKDLKNAYPGEEILIGAGTVLDPETARLALLAGAEYIVSPILNLELVRLCNRYQKISMPGCMSINEIVQAMEAGADVIKLFPGSAFGPDMVKAIRGPLPQAVLLPTGGVSLENVQEWIKNGCIAVGVGGELTKGAEKGDYARVQEKARQFVEKVKAARL
jgi:2-dehydro-3-deoxyphosphogluconate aldolase/(4S)-4-hydroxy-2-oxoglutarate aldolase